jgi:hypothetical protein
MCFESVANRIVCAASTSGHDCLQGMPVCPTKAMAVREPTLCRARLPCMDRDCDRELRLRKALHARQVIAARLHDYFATLPHEVPPRFCSLIEREWNKVPDADQLPLSSPAH